MHVPNGESLRYNGMPLLWPGEEARYSSSLGSYSHCILFFKKVIAVPDNGLLWGLNTLLHSSMYSNFIHLISFKRMPLYWFCVKKSAARKMMYI